MVVLSSFQTMKYPSVRQRHGKLMGIRCGVPAEKTQYKDGVLERAFMGLFAKKMEKFGKRGDDDDEKKKKWIFDYDYESFVEVSRGVMMGRSRAQQQQLVRQVLLSMLPPQAPAQFRKLFPPTKWAAEFNAALTVPFFNWLVGPSQVIEVEVNGVRQKSGVLIKKCRYLENSGCVGMCVNMCKIPTQDFFTNEFGLPLTMTPNFEDMSCEMVYGRIPPKFEDDPASKQPCLAHFCSIAQPNSTICPKLQA
ncbi:beta-carotene isomerase D27 [Striga asiatica]|uniref:Beta-carotene isomerase D27 n=1 Tax=Striga asiatica TaxID=4170 RepID=A0A5A7Q421_STRAF|nr:beta-carotene isomerase D27 [Striga asiatica]